MFMYIWTGVMSICVFFSSGAGPRWQFQDIDGLWKDYSKGSSVSSQDIELQYQQNPSGTVKFTTNSYGYELDLSGELQHLQTDGSICRSSPDLLKVFSFAAMSQKNMSTSTTRSVRRLQQWLRRQTGRRLEVNTMLTLTMASGPVSGRLSNWNDSVRFFTSFLISLLFGRHYARVN